MENVNVANLRKGRKFALAMNDTDSIMIVEYVSKSGDTLTVQDVDGEFDVTLDDARLYRALPSTELTSRTKMAEEEAQVKKAAEEVEDTVEEAPKADDKKADEPKADDKKADEPKAKTKREIAEEIVEKGIAAGLKRKEMIEQIMAAAKMSKAGASTYYFNAKSKISK